MAAEYPVGSPIEIQAAANMEQLRNKTYSGRGIVLGLNSDGTQAVQVYWITGRSEPSKERIITRDKDVVRSTPIGKVKDPLTLYTAMAIFGEMHIVSNGDPTDAIESRMTSWGTIEEVFAETTYEPDIPNYTPRITGAVFSYIEIPFIFSIIRKAPESFDTIRDFYELPPMRGIGYCIHTYKGEDMDPLPSFDSEPYPSSLMDLLMK